MPILNRLRKQPRQSALLDVRVALIERLDNRCLLAAALSLSPSGAQTISPSAFAYANNNNVPDSTGVQTEVAVSVSPLNPLDVAGISYRFVNQVNVGLDFFRSADGGATWTRTTIDDNIDHQGTMGVTRIDPVISYADDGRLFVAYCVFNTEAANIVVGRRADVRSF
jgi:hypothetical protein